MRYVHSFTVKAPLEHVAEFHRRASSMVAITPPPIIVKLHDSPKILSSGDEMAFTTWIGPLPVRWLARIEDSTATGFVDRQLEGPFTSWVHQHQFIVLDAKTTKVLDKIEVSLSQKPLDKFIGLNMFLGLPLLFAYRQWQTKRLLEKQR